MSVKITSVKCPECGANLPIEEGRTQIFCSYCGTKVMVTNENEFIYHHIDETKIRQAEAESAVELKRLEMEERRIAEKQKVRKIKIIISIILGLVALLSFVVAYSKGEGVAIGMLSLIIIFFMWGLGNNKESDDGDERKVTVPMGIGEYEKKSYVAVEAMLKGAGFTNIKCVSLNDLTLGLLKTPDTVESIVINGKEINMGGKKFSPDATVVISYHSYAQK